MGIVFWRRVGAFAGGLAAVLIVGSPALAQVDDFDPQIFVRDSDVYNCSDFDNQAQAQQVLRADPTDPNGLDPDRNGIACSNLSGAQDLNKVTRPSTGTSTGSEDGRAGASVSGRPGSSTNGADQIASSANPTPTPTPTTAAARSIRSSTLTPVSIARPVIPDVRSLAALATGATPSPSPTPSTKGSGNAGGSIGSGTGVIAGGTSGGAPGGVVGAEKAADQKSGGGGSGIARTGANTLLAVAIFAFLATLGLLLRKEDLLGD